VSDAAAAHITRHWRGEDGLWRAAELLITLPGPPRQPHGRGARRAVLRVRRRQALPDPACSGPHRMGRVSTALILEMAGKISNIARKRGGTERRSAGRAWLYIWLCAAVQSRCGPSARLLDKAEVTGSSPVSPIIKSSAFAGLFWLWFETSSCRPSFGGAGWSDLLGLRCMPENLPVGTAALDVSDRRPQPRVP
jgi:hypothetical protein